ncbi:TetR-like C-terminal domain-containing protein [Curtobacterium sp. MCBA15_013]|uniref:TetR-like C-terminal domain-containing protein n=2 Tax=unclassified Curtobacterium TaxID=257496 RepID=UPI0015872685|nr:TetR/AcrR family transcriptional regulator [Curtobacterium sp. MCBA15_013]
MQRSLPARAIDPRPARTRAAIIAATEHLVAADRTAEVSVNAIVRTAGVSRSAFYAQFSDLDELAVAMLVDAFREIGLDDLRARAEDLAGDGAGSAGDARRRLAAASNRRLVEHIAARYPFYRASLDWRLSGRVHETVVSAYADQVAATMRVLDDRVPAGVGSDDMARFIAGGAIALLTAWLRDDAPEQQDRIVERLLAVMPDWLVGSD